MLESWKDVQQPPPDWALPARRRLLGPFGSPERTQDWSPITGQGRTGPRLRSSRACIRRFQTVRARRQSDPHPLIRSNSIGPSPTEATPVGRRRVSCLRRSRREDASGRARSGCYGTGIPRKFDRSHRWADRSTAASPAASATQTLTDSGCSTSAAASTTHPTLVGEEARW
jgi:hypothetical protein